MNRLKMSIISSIRRQQKLIQQVFEKVTPPSWLFTSCRNYQTKTKVYKMTSCDDKRPNRT